MKKMLLKNWFWVVVILVCGLKYGTAQQKDFSIGWNGGVSLNKDANIGGSNGLSVSYKEFTLFYSTGAYLSNFTDQAITNYIEGRTNKLVTGGSYTRLGFSIDITKSGIWTPRLGAGTVLDDKISTEPSSSDSNTLIYIQPGLTIDITDKSFISFDYNIAGPGMDQALFGFGIRF